MSYSTTIFCVFALVASAASAGEQEVRLVPDRDSCLYDLGETVGWTVHIEEPTETAYTYEVLKDNKTPVKSGAFSPLRNGDRIEASLDCPGMLYLKVIQEGVNDKPPAAVAGAAVDPYSIDVAAPTPPDFDQFWESKISLVDLIDAKPKLEKKKSGVDSVEYATLSMDHPLGGKVHAQIAHPSVDDMADEGKFPAMVIFQWASPPYPLEPSWVTWPASNNWLTLNVQPHDVPVAAPATFYEQLPESAKRYESIGADDRDASYFLRMYLGDYLAVDYITKHPKWDGKTLLVMGTSMGGQQSLCIAGLHPEVTHLIVNVPAGCDTNGPLHGRQQSYPNFSPNDPLVMQTALYFDPVNFAPQIKATSLVAMGFIDKISAPTGIWAAYNRISGPKEVVPLVNSPHNHRATPEEQLPYTKRSAEWIEQLAEKGAVDLVEEGEQTGQEQRLMLQAN